MPSPPSDSLILSKPDDLKALGPFLRAARRRAGLRAAKDAAPYLGVSFRLLVQLESGTRGKRGVTITKLMGILGGLGLDLVIRPRAGVLGTQIDGPSSVLGARPATKRVRRG